MAEPQKEKIELTLQDLLQNPTGKNTAFMAARYRIISDLEARYGGLRMLRGKFPFKVFKRKKDYIFHVEVPSETLPTLSYDVVVMFTPEQEGAEDDRTVNRYNLRLFSNSPYFTFTYTFVMNDNELLVPFLKDKCSSQALTEPPNVRNPVQVYGFEKSVYFACLWIKEAGLTNKFDLDQNLFLFSEAKFKASIVDQESKLKEYGLAKKQVSSAKRKSKKATKATKSKGQSKVKKTGSGGSGAKGKK